MNLALITNIEYKTKLMGRKETCVEEPLWELHNVG